MNTTETAKYPSDELDEIRRLATSLDGERDLDPLIDRLRDCRYVLLGEASHGTSDYYRWRARISRRLIEEHGFSFVAVEGDWPDCYRVNRYIKGFEDCGDSAYEEAWKRAWPAENAATVLATAAERAWQAAGELAAA